MSDGPRRAVQEITTQFKVSVPAIVRVLRASSTPAKPTGGKRCVFFAARSMVSTWKVKSSGGERFDPVTETCDLESIFTVRRDDEAIYQVHGWLVDVTVSDRSSKFYVM